MKFGKVFKQLIILTSTKLNTLSKVVGYDPSYLSRFSNGKLLPKGKQTSQFFESLAKYFASIILESDLYDVVSKEFTFSNNKNNLEKELLILLQESYQESLLNQSSDLNRENSTCLYTLDQAAYFILQQIETHLILPMDNSLSNTLIDQMIRSDVLLDFELYLHQSLDINKLKQTQKNLVIKQTSRLENHHYVIINKEIFISVNYFKEKQSVILLNTSMDLAMKNLVLSSFKELD